jgi:hypothetical protein
MTQQRFEPGTFQIEIYSFTATKYLFGCLLTMLNIVCALDRLSYDIYYHKAGQKLVSKIYILR